MQKTLVKRDSRIREKQEKITAYLAETAKVVSLSLKEERYLPLIECLNDVNRILADLHHDGSRIRRNPILSSKH
jgi:hypothetical protein